MSRFLNLVTLSVAALAGTEGYSDNSRPAAFFHRFVTEEERNATIELAMQKLGVIKSHESYEQRFAQNTLSKLPRGGYQDNEATDNVDTEQGGLSLEQKVHRAMQKLGIAPPVPPPPSKTAEEGEAETCVDGVCSIPDSKTDTPSTEPPPDPRELAESISKELNVDISLVWAALAATSTGSSDDQRVYNVQEAREMIQHELDIISNISEDADAVKQLTAEGFDPFLSRRALAFAEMDLDNARAILLADQEDEETDQEATQPASGFKTVAVNTNFDPTQMDAQESQKPREPTPAKKSDVIFEATASQIQELVLESPVPVLLDVYADWCGPCKALTPVLEEMAIKSGGAFRLVKVNSDNERSIASGALQVSALPTVFGISGGKIRHRFQGMPRSQEVFQNFMMGLLVPGQVFNPPVTPAEQKEYDELSAKLMQAAGGASFSFGSRERLQDRVVARLEDLIQQAGGDILEAEGSAQTMRSLLSNVIQNPLETKYRTVKLTNKVIAATVGKYKAALSILKSVGFQDNGDVMVLGAGKIIINVAPLICARDCIDKWIGEKRYEVAKANRKRQDEEARQKLLAENLERNQDGEEDVEDEEEAVVDPNACTLKVRIEGKKKVHSLDCRGDDPLSSILEKVPLSADSQSGQDVQITCVAKKLVVKSSDSAAMSKPLRSLGLMPSASIVLSVVSDKKEASTSNLAERAAAKKKKRKGSHTMQSVGIYAKDDHLKGELVDGGGGVLYEQDVTDDEEEADEKQDADIDEAPKEDEDNDVASKEATEYLANNH
jgi:thiol-disulfide isomerase/thioredoxin